MCIVSIPQAALIVRYLATKPIASHFRNTIIEIKVSKTNTARMEKNTSDLRQVIHTNEENKLTAA